MKLAKGFALVLGFVAAVALGIWIGPHVTDRDRTVTEVIAPATQAPDVSPEPQQHAQPVRRARVSQRASTRPTTTTAAMMRTSPGATPLTLPTAAPALHEVLKPLLNKGADMGVAAEAFVDAEQFAAVAHAARNTEIPFMVLKDRIVEKGKNLESAIHELKPGLNAEVEASRAHREAKADISALKAN